MIDDKTIAKRYAIEVRNRAEGESLTTVKFRLARELGITILDVSHACIAHKEIAYAAVEKRCGGDPAGGRSRVRGGDRRPDGGVSVDSLSLIHI